MNNLYSNITNKNNFCSKLTAPSVLLMSLVYILSVTLVPAINSIINTKSTAYVSAAKQYNAISNSALVTKTNNSVFNTINTATYINNGQMLARQIDDNSLQSYINDAKGSVLKLNNSDAVKTQNYNYDAYGSLVIAQSAKVPRNNLASTATNPFQYNGERSDNNTKLQYLRARFYNSETKRFINQDTYDILNKFNYADADPITNSDPSGHESASFWAAIGLGIAAGLLVTAGIVGTGILIYKNSNIRTKTSFPPWNQFTQRDTVSCGQFAVRNFMQENQITEEKYNEQEFAKLRHKTAWKDLLATYSNYAPQNKLTVISDGTVKYYPQQSDVLDGPNLYKRTEQFAHLSSLLSQTKEAAPSLPQDKEMQDTLTNSITLLVSRLEKINTISKYHSIQSILESENITNMLIRNAEGGHWIQASYKKGVLTVRDSLCRTPYQTTVEFLYGKTIYY